jgi:NAD(P)-dependent dehydrogenase (short-subunit alcohol dehydrogenase family)
MGAELRRYFLKNMNIHQFHDGSVSVVVGGHTGIGRGVAQALAERRGRVEIAGRRNGLDLADPGSVAAYFERLGDIDHLIITAGSSAPGGTVTEVEIDAAKAAFDVKFWGSVTVAREAAKRLRPGGTITLTSGFLSRRTTAGTYVKTAMNAALEAFAKVLAKELAPLRVNVVSPGLTDTEAYAAMPQEARRAMLERAAAHLPAGRHGTTEDLARGYLFAIDNPFLTGAVIDIDGGALIS